MCEEQQEAPVASAGWVGDSGRREDQRGPGGLEARAGLWT